MVTCRYLPPSTSAIWWLIIRYRGLNILYLGIYKDENSPVYIISGDNSHKLVGKAVLA